MYLPDVRRANIAGTAIETMSEINTRRRNLLQLAGVGTLLGTGLAGCTGDNETKPPAASAYEAKPRQWKMVTTWPKNFPGLGTGAEFLAEQINAMSNGRIHVKVYGAGELVPAFVVVPIVGPILLGLGIDPIWLGVMIAINLQTSFLTPPFGFALFYLRGVAPKEVKTGQIYRGVAPFIAIQVVALLLIAYFPALATWLPGKIY